MQWFHETCDIELVFVPLDFSSLRLMLFTGASFDNASNFRSQLGFVIVLADVTITPEILFTTVVSAVNWLGVPSWRRNSWLWCMNLFTLFSLKTFWKNLWA